MPSKISSLTNTKIKNVVRLRQRNHRDETEMTVVEGIKEIECALRSSVELTEVYVCSGEVSKKYNVFIKELESLDIECFETSKEVFNKISYGERNDGALAVCKTPHTSVHRIEHKKDGLYLVFEQIEKPGNLGAVLRTADAANVDGVFVCDPRTDLYNPNVIRSSIGAVFSVPVVKCTNEEALQFLKQQNLSIFAAMPNAVKGLYSVNFKAGSAVVLGSEEKGLTDFWAMHASQKISIPMNGKVDSLNVSVSAAIILYEAYRQRQN
ncbi:MAG: RNA methyltransferase [Candidatus Omnitrophica bacterium]|nr:RNA methyltransferase [Candidatus Omnitrophota bacterium]